MNRLSIAVVALVLLMLSCKGNRTASPVEVPADSVASEVADTEDVDTLEQLIADTPMPQAADELFDDFLFNVVANKRLQMERVLFPLTTTRNGDTTQMARDDWRMERFFMRQGYYTLLFGSRSEMAQMNDTSLTEATVEKIYFNTGAVIQYKFRRLRGAWMLTQVDTQPIQANANASFLQFYHRFVTDSLFQGESLEAEVQFEGPDPDDDFAKMEGILTPDTWPAFPPELPDKMIYNIVYGPRKPRTDRIIFMLRGIANGLETELTFRRHGDQWRLAMMKE